MEWQLSHSSKTSAVMKRPSSLLWPRKGCLSAWGINNYVMQMSADNKKRDDVATVVQFSAVTKKRLLECMGASTTMLCRCRRTTRKEMEWQLSYSSPLWPRKGCSSAWGINNYVMQMSAENKKRVLAQGTSVCCFEQENNTRVGINDYADSENLSTRKAWEKWGIDDYVTEIVSTHSADNKKRLLKVNLMADIQRQPNGCDCGLFALAEASELALWCVTGMFLKCESVFCLVYSQDECYHSFHSFFFNP